MRLLAQFISRTTIVVLCVALIATTALAQRGNLTCESNDGRYQYCRADTRNNVRLTRQLSRSDCRQGRSWGYDRRGIWVDRGCRAEFEFGEGSDSGPGKAVAIGAGVAGAAILAAIIASRRSNDYKNLDSTQRSYYDRGYYLGKQDKRYGYDRQFNRHKDEYDQSYESYFKKGYENGFEASGDDGDSDRNTDEDRSDTPNWAVGTFMGYSQQYNGSVELRIFSDGEVRGKVLSSGEAIDGYYRRDRITTGRQKFMVRKVGNGISLTEIGDSGSEAVYRRVY